MTLLAAPADLPSNYPARLKLYRLDEAVCRRAAALWPIVRPALADAMASFHAAECENPAISGLFQRHGEEICRLEGDHLALLLRGRIDATYVASSERLAAEYERLGVYARTRLLAGNMVHSTAMAAISRRYPFRGRRIAAIGADLANLLDFDIAITLTVQMDTALRASETRRQNVERAIHDFEPAIGSVVESVAAASKALRVSSAELREIAEDTSRRMVSAAHVAGEIAAGIEDTAAATEQLAQSIAEIGAQSDDSLRLAQAATSDARLSMTSLDELAAAAHQIGSVVELISTIAAQTNLLALNATIEAARAGEAGRGFAVVAAEVKALAGQTARATDDISRQIAAIQEATRRSVAQIGGVASVVSNISTAALAIAASVEEQGAATRSISDGIRRMASTTMGASDDVHAVEAASGRSLAAAEALVGWTESLSTGAGALQHDVEHFFTSVRHTG